MLENETQSIDAAIKTLLETNPSGTKTVVWVCLYLCTVCWYSRYCMYSSVCGMFACMGLLMSVCMPTSGKHVHSDGVSYPHNRIEAILPRTVTHGLDRINIAYETETLADEGGPAYVLQCGVARNSTARLHEFVGSRNISSLFTSFYLA